MGREDSKEFDGGLELGIKSILVSPNFLFRIERDPKDVKPGAVYEISASGTCLAVVILPLEHHSGRHAAGAWLSAVNLKKPEVFEAQVRRMLQIRVRVS